MHDVHVHNTVLGQHKYNHGKTGIEFPFKTHTQKMRYQLTLLLWGKKLKQNKTKLSGCFLWLESA